MKVKGHEQEAKMLFVRPCTVVMMISDLCERLIKGNVMGTKGRLLCDNSCDLTRFDHNIARNVYHNEFQNLIELS